MAVLASAQVNITYVHDDAHFWSDSEGAHVTYTEEGETISGGNVLITADGIQSRDGGTTVASFGENGAIIGKNGSQHIVITPNALTAINSAGQTAVRIAREYKAGTKEITEIYPGDSKKIKISYPPEENSEVAIKLNRADPNDYDVSEVTFIHKTGESDEKQLSLHNMPVYATYNAEDITDGVTVKLEYVIDDDTKYVNTVEVRYSTTQVNIVAASFANGKFEVGWSGNTTTHGSLSASGNITAKGGVYDVSGNLRTAINDKAAASHTHTASDITDLAKRFQAGYINITPGSETKTFNGVKYYEGTVTVTFAQAFDSDPSISLTPSTAVPYKMALGASNVSKTGFTIEFFRDSQTGAGIHWIAMGGTQ